MRSIIFVFYFALCCHCYSQTSYVVGHPNDGSTARGVAMDEQFNNLDLGNGEISRNFLYGFGIGRNIAHGWRGQLIENGRILPKPYISGYWGLDFYVKRGEPALSITQNKDLKLEGSLFYRYDDAFTYGQTNETIFRYGMGSYSGTAYHYNQNELTNDLSIDGENDIEKMYMSGYWGIDFFVGDNIGDYGSAMTITHGRQVVIGNKGIPYPNHNYKLSVDGKIAAEEVLIELSSEWGDYVFGEDYDLTELNEVKNYIEKHKHLPGIPSAKSIGDKGGVEIGDMQRLSMVKIEELTLYLIKINEEKEALEIENKKIIAEFNKLKKELKDIKDLFKDFHAVH